VNAPPASGELPVLVTVKVFAVLATPVGQTPNASGLGLTVAVRVTAVPVPVRETGEPVTVTLAEIVAVPIEATTVFGEKTTLMVQVEPADRAAAQVPPAVPVGLANGAVTATTMPVAFAPPVLESEMVCAALVLPASVFGNASAFGTTARIA
jgi:hypothetical protein